jgi:hypothetical protein
MTRKGRTLASLAAAVAALLATLAYVDSAFDWESVIGLCNVPVTSVTPDPNGTLSAVAFEVYCGPVPPSNTHVSLVPKGRRFSRKRSVDFLVLDGSYHLPIQWTEESTLEIGLPAQAKAFKRETRIEHVTVNYRPIL